MNKYGHTLYWRPQDNEYYWKLNGYRPDKLGKNIWHNSFQTEKDAIDTLEHCLTPVEKHYRAFNKRFDDFLNSEEK